MNRVLTDKARLAENKLNILRTQIDSLEKYIENRRAEIVDAMKENDWEIAADRANAAIEHQNEINERWVVINELRNVVDDGTTHIEEKGDFA